MANKTKNGHILFSRRTNEEYILLKEIARTSYNGKCWYYILCINIIPTCVVNNTFLYLLLKGMHTVSLIACNFLRFKTNSFRF